MNKNFYCTSCTPWDRNNWNNQSLPEYINYPDKITFDKKVNVEITLPFQTNNFLTSLTFYEKVRMVRRTDAEMFDLYEKYKDGIDFSIKGPKVKGSYLRLAIFFAVICKAYYYEKDLDRLRHFMHVCYTGENAKPEDNAALHLKTVFTHAKVKKEPIDKTEWTKKILSSLQSFMKYEPRSKLHEISYDPYPLPDFSDMKNEENRKAVV